VATSREHDESTCSITVREFHKKLSDYQLLKKDSVHAVSWYQVGGLLREATNRFIPWPAMP
jgi:hypothetical protein